MPVDHYENFPVASRLLPPRLRRAVTDIYWFARSADDIADEGHAVSEARLAALDEYRRELDRIARGEAASLPLFRRLALTVADHRLPLGPFHDLLDAFSQDVVKTRYADIAELLAYCERSANPVGRLLLHLYGHAGSQSLMRSDAVCTALQLINFWQDVAVDWDKGRVYLPQDELRRFAVSEAQIGQRRCDAAFRRLMAFQVDRARALMLQGAPLARELPGRIGIELRLIVQGGLRVLEKIESAGYDVFERRPVLATLDWPLLAWRALRYRAAGAQLPSPAHGESARDRGPAHARPIGDGGKAAQALSAKETQRRLADGGPSRERRIS